jgi:hypothetical protein
LIVSGRSPGGDYNGGAGCDLPARSASNARRRRLRHKNVNVNGAAHQGAKTGLFEVFFQELTTRTRHCTVEP